MRARSLLGVAPLLVSAWCAMAQSPIPDPLVALAERYEHLSSAEVEWTVRTSAGAIVQRTRGVTCVASDGRFAYREWITTDGHPEPGDEFPKYFVYCDGKRLSYAVAEGSRYTDAALDPKRPVVPGPSQHYLAPWPMISRWCHAIGPNADIRSERDGHRATATLARGVTFSLTWGPSQELREVCIQDLESESRYEYSEFAPEEGLLLPRRIRTHVTIRTGGAERIVDEVRERTSLVLAPPDAQLRLAFDPQAWRVRYFDEATGDVYSPDRSQRLFNIRDMNDDRERERAHTRAMRLAWVAALGALVAGSLWLAWRKARSVP